MTAQQIAWLIMGYVVSGVLVVGLGTRFMFWLTDNISWCLTLDHAGDVFFFGFVVMVWPLVFVAAILIGAIYVLGGAAAQLSSAGKK